MNNKFVDFLEADTLDIHSTYVRQKT